MEMPIRDEYIKKEAIINHLRECEGTPPEIGYTYPIFKAIECFVENLSAADVVEVEEVIAKIEREIEDENTSSTLYVCEDGTKIHTDVGYVQDWFEYYADVLRRWAKGGRSDGEI